MSCTAIFFLVREERSGGRERERRGAYEHTSTKHPSSSYLYPNSSTFGLWRTRLATLFRRGTKDDTRARSDTSQTKTKGGGHGWVQAALEDDWDVEETREAPATSGIQQVSFRHPSMLQPIPVSRADSDSTSSVRFDLGAIRTPASRDRHPSPHPTLPKIHSPLSSSPSSSHPPSRVRSPEPISAGTTPVDNDTRKLLPPPTPRVFQGGSKFIEAL